MTMNESIEKAISETQCDGCSKFWLGKIGGYPYCNDCAKWVCPECGEMRADDPRIESGMKCGNCAYGDSIYEN